MTMSGDLSYPPVHLVGVGSLGGPIALLLAKAGVRNLHVYDPDVVEPKNIENQLYCDFLIGMPKVEAITWVLDALSSMRPQQNPLPVYRIPMAGVVVISAVDNMDSRKKLFLSSKKAAAFIDGRVGGDVARLYFIRPSMPEDRAFYESTLYTDEEAVDDPCLSASTVHTCWSAASLIASNFLKMCRGETAPREIIIDHATVTMTSQ